MVIPQFFLNLTLPYKMMNYFKAVEERIIENQEKDICLQINEKLEIIINEDKVRRKFFESDASQRPFREDRDGVKVEVEGQ